MKLGWHKIKRIINQMSMNRQMFWTALRDLTMPCAVLFLTLPECSKFYIFIMSKNGFCLKFLLSATFSLVKNSSIILYIFSEVFPFPYSAFVAVTTLKLQSAAKQTLLFTLTSSQQRTDCNTFHNYFTFLAIYVPGKIVTKSLKISS